MRWCSVCHKPFFKGNGTLFSVPKDEQNRRKWGEICKRSFKRTSLVCVDHFLPSSVVRAGKKVCLLPNAEPFSQQLNEFDVSINSTIETSITDTICFGEADTDMPSLQQEPIEERGKEQGTQTDPSIFTINAKEYFKRIRLLESENADLKSELAQAIATISTMKKIFTEGQLRKLGTGGPIQWRLKDISSAICLHASGPRAYNHLYKQGFPLPHVSTLQRWCASVRDKEGILTSSLNFMSQSTDLTPEEKICILAFDEMKVAETFEYDPVGDVVRKPANYVQVVMARGLKKSWKQPVFYDYDCKMTKPLLQTIICKLCAIGFPVVATVCDMGFTNRKLWSDLGVTTDKPWFPNPVCGEEKIFCFADVPHLLKLIRNHYLDSGLIFQNQVLSSRTIQELRSLTSASDVSITFKLTDDHIWVKGAARQKVKLAAQLFSHTIANAIRRCYSLGMELYKPTETADFIQLVNDWFDIHNSKIGTFKYPGKEPFGTELEKQKSILNKMSELMAAPIIPGKSSLEFFQRGILMSNTALLMLHKYVEKYNMTYLLTNRLNQDILENFFGAIRSKGGLNDHPSPMDFKYRLRKYILATNTEYLHGKGNVEDDTTDWLNTNENERFPNPQKKPNTQENAEEICDEISQQEELDGLDESNLEDIGMLQEDGLEYISGYIIKKLNLEGYECLENSFTWVDQVSKVSLKKPKYSFVSEIKRLEQIFATLNGDEISHSPNIKEKLMELSKSVNLPNDIKKLFFKCRIYFRVRHLNQRLKKQKDKQRLMGSSKLIKMKL